MRFTWSAYTITWMTVARALQSWIGDFGSLICHLKIPRGPAIALVRFELSGLSALASKTLSRLQITWLGMTTRTDEHVPRMTFALLRLVTSAHRSLATLLGMSCQPW